MRVTDHYRTLEIDRQATPGTIKRAFRRLAKEYHPDKNPTRQDFAERMFREIALAYEVLGNPEQRFRYDLTLRTARRNEKLRNAHLERLRRSRQTQRKFDYMFQQLLTQNYETGIRVYEQLQRANRKFRIDNFLDYQDSRDCEFLIAEAYQTLGDAYKAMDIYESLLAYEKRRPVFHHFSAEIKARLKNIYLRALTRPEHPETIPNDLEKLHRLELSKRETAGIYKRLAESYFELNWFAKAREMLRVAFELHPSLTGTKKIRQKLCMDCRE